jgi:hypothetical protein
MAGEELALRIRSQQKALEGDVHRFDLGVPADHGGWPGSGSRVVWITYGVHVARPSLDFYT